MLWQLVGTLVLSIVIVALVADWLGGKLVQEFPEELEMDPEFYCDDW